MDQEKINKVTADLQKKYPEVGIRAISVDENSGQSTFFLDPKPKTLAYLERGGVVPKAFKEKAAVITRDTLDRTFLDLAPTDPLRQTPRQYYENAINYYYTEPLLGSTVNLLAGLSSKGFEHDIDDENIKNFYDVWAFDVKFHEFLEWVFLDFFKTGHVTTYKVLAKYEPRVSYLSPIPGQKLKKNGNKGKATGQLTPEQEAAAKKNIWSKGHLPVNYTVLNPLLVNISGNLLFDKVSVKLTPPPELAEVLKKSQSELTEEEKELIKSLPSDLKAAAQGGGEFQLDSRLVGFITYRKMPYERYARPRSFKLFDNIEYKRSLRQADISTLDGITNYILKITIGNDEYPVVTQEELEAVSQLFNTPGKSFDVIWNHTLKVEKIVSPEIGDILGQDKYKQNNEDMSAGLAITRALIDGVGDLSAPEAQLVIKGIEQEVEYARRQVTTWIYREYRQIAEAMGFDRFPKIRWDESVLKDTLMYMNVLSTLVDRRMLSYNTALEQLGFDYPSELNRMQTELPLVEDGVFGIIGSPWQQAKGGGLGGVQPVQGGPTGSPSNGRPVSQPAGKKSKTTPAQKNKNQKQAQTKPKKQQAASLQEIIEDMSDEDFMEFQRALFKIRDNRDTINEEVEEAPTEEY
jgi:hypothetical protein